MATGVAVALVAAVRAVLGRLAGEPGMQPGGSFDTWPAVPPAPRPGAADGVGVGDGSDLPDGG